MMLYVYAEVSSPKSEDDARTIIGRLNEVIESLFIQVAPPSERNTLMDRLQEIHNRKLDEERHATT